MTLISFAVRIDLQCELCAAPIAIAGLSERVRCPGCDTELVLDDDFLERVLSDELERRAELAPPLFRVRAGMTALGHHRTSYGLAAPRCACGRELAVASLAGDDDRAITCGVCGERTALRRLVPAERMGHERARGLIYEHRPAPRLEDGGAICVWCPREGCGDAMGLDAYAPVVPCDSCGQAIELERARWDHLARLAGARHFYVLLEED